MTIGQELISFYKNIERPNKLPAGVELLFPFEEEEVLTSIAQFYHKYFDDGQRRYLLMGINPGRFGGGVTGVPFTDPEKLSSILGIENNFDRRYELSSQFIYEMIDFLGGPASFYSKFLLSSVCPLGFVKEGKNMNYYDDKELQDMLEEYMVANIRWHMEQVAEKDIVYSLGQGKNVKYLEYLNKKHQLFGKVIPLPHPRWILQYRRKRKDEFLELYRKELLDRS